MIWDAEPYAWPTDKTSAACVSVDVDALSPWLWEHRQSLPRTLAAYEHRQYGLRRGLARLVAMLDSLGVQASFFVPAVVAEENPTLLPGLVQRGHEIALHGYYHERVNDIDDVQFTEALESSIELFVRQTGQRPAGFRSPAWEMTPHMLSELHRLQLWDSSLMGDDLPYRIAGVTEVPVRWDNDDAIFFKFLGAGDRPPRSDAEIERQWRGEAASQHRHGGLFMLTVHDWISGRPGRVDLLERLIREWQSQETIWLTTCGQLAAHEQHHCQGLDVHIDRPIAINERITGNE